MDEDMDRRVRDRSPVSFRPARLFSLEGRFLADAAILERSADGARLRLFGNAGEAAEVYLYDETDRRRWRARRVWSDGYKAGYAFLSVPEAPEREEAERVFGRYYAMTH
ncbi:hypothetical protein [Aurantimonas sp. Leaf443]|uniref:hypothetical protein n=1 Tax=Aurantimonas sp. Leaf443 TaxID=1736378 RepID=UPI0006F2EC8B|nr:hypothetical protein [Aurantimonas sp. Leaf443]KQT82459.1 hypothetical protein ASG48_15405 [Aurantimonas sp. Leaf443]